MRKANKMKKGFSTVELLTVVAILAALIAVAVPGLLAVKNNLEMRQLNDTAREIFVAAQNSLSAQKAAGTVESLDISEKDTATGDWMYETDAGRETLLPDGSIESTVGSHHFAINYDSSTGVVLAVYYSEKEEALEGSDTLYDSYSGDQNEKARKEDKIGYYDSEDIEKETIETGNEEGLTVLKVELCNSKDADDALKLQVTFDGTNPSDDTLTITIINSDKSEQKLNLSIKNATTTEKNGKQVLEWVLDSLKGPHFKDLNDDENDKNPITPGAYIKAIAQVEGQDPCYSGTEENSLFGSLDNGKATIRSARHLQNLSSDFSEVNTTETTVKTAVQTKSIDWIDAAIEGFTPITNSKLTSFDGNGYEIQNLVIQGSGKKNVGLFSELNGTNLTDIHLNAPVIKELEDTVTTVGALVGSAKNCTIENCQVYADSKSLDSSGIFAEDATTVGGLVGSATGNSTITNCSASLPTVEGKETVGGLVGSLTNSTVSKSYASTGYRSDKDGDWEGGLSTANSASDSKTGTIGGIVGSMSGSSSLTDSYVSGYIQDGADSAGGLIGNYQSGTVQRCYSVATVGSDNASGTYKGLAGSGTLSGEKLYFWEDGAKGDGGKSLAEIANLKDTLNDKENESKIWTTGKDEDTTSYSECCTGFYPYPMVSDLHYYGDWPTEQFAKIEVTINEATTITIDNTDDTTSAKTDSTNADDTTSTETDSTNTDDATGTKTDSTDGTNVDDETNKNHYIFAQLGSKATMTFEAWGNDGKNPAVTSVSIEFLDKDDILSDALTKIYDPETGYTFTLDTTKIGKTGVFGADITVNGSKFRTVFVVFDIQIKLEPTGGTGANLKTGYSRFENEKEILGQLTLDSTSAHRKGSVTAEIAQIAPSLTELTEKLKNIATNLPEGTNLLTKYDGEALETNWEKIKDISVPYDCRENGVINVTSSDSDSNRLNIEGKNSGNTFVQAHWAMDESVYAQCRVTMEGSRALIKTVAFDGTQMGGEYPYQVDLEAVPGQELQLQFLPNLFNEPKDDSGEFTYQWKLYRTLPGEAEEELTEYSKTYTSKDTPYEVTITDGKKEASYRSELTFTYYKDEEAKKNGEVQTSVDETNVKVYRKGSRKDDTYAYIKVQEEDYRETKTMGVSETTVEQVNGKNTVYEGCNQSTLTGYLDGAVDSQIRWYVYTVGTLDGTESTPDDEKWKQVTGAVGSIQVFDENGLERATVKWDQSTDSVTVGEEEYATGGSVIVTGLDADEFDSTFTFMLKAEVVDAVTGEGTESYKLVAAKVMPQLSIDPHSKSKAARCGGNFSVFTANRADSKWDYTWTAGETLSNEPNNSDWARYGSKLQIYLNQYRYTDLGCVATGTDGTNGIPENLCTGWENHYGVAWSKSATEELPDWQRTAVATPGFGSMVTRSCLITLNYGPYTATATFEARRQNSTELISSINQDITVNNVDYFLLEKNRSRKLQFSWAFFSSAWYAIEKPEEDNADAYATLHWESGLGKLTKITKYEDGDGDTGNAATWTSVDNSTIYNGRSSGVASNEGTWTYSATGNRFTRTADGEEDPLNLSWTMKNLWISKLATGKVWCTCPDGCTETGHDHSTRETYNYGFEYNQIKTTTYTYTKTVTETGGGPDRKTSTVVSEKTKTGESTEDCGSKWMLCCQNQECNETHITTTEKLTNTQITKTSSGEMGNPPAPPPSQTTVYTYAVTETEYLLNGNAIQHEKRNIGTEIGYYKEGMVPTYTTGKQNPQTLDGYQLYVVGLDVRSSASYADDNNIVSEIRLDAPGATRTVYADAFFPANLQKSGTKATVTWSVDEGSIVELTGDTTTEVGSSMPAITIEAKKYTAENAYATLTCVYKVTDLNGRERTYTRNIPIYVGNADYEMSVQVTPCGKDDLDTLKALFGAEVSDLWLNQQNTDGSYLLVEDSLFGANTMYLKVQAKDTLTGNLLNLENYYANIYSDRYYITTEQKIPDGDSKALYVKITAVPDHANTSAKAVDVTVELGTADMVKEKIWLYKNPTTAIYEDGVLVTGKSWPIAWPSGSEQETAARDIAKQVETKTYTATLVPALRDMDGNLMDGIVWYLDSPSGYSVSSYLSFTAASALTEDGTLTGSGQFVLTRNNGVPLIPDFRVVLNAQSSTAYYGQGPGGKSVKAGTYQVGSPSTIGEDGTRTGSANPLLSTSGYAVVFLPEVR